MVRQKALKYSCVIPQFHFLPDLKIDTSIGLHKTGKSDAETLKLINQDSVIRSNVQFCFHGMSHAT